MRRLLGALFLSLLLQGCIRVIIIDASDKFLILDNEVTIESTL